MFVEFDFDVRRQQSINFFTGGRVIMHDVLVFWPVDIVKLACESQLTEILFKLIIIKLAWESQLTDILFKLILIIILTRLNF